MYVEGSPVIVELYGHESEPEILGLIRRSLPSLSYNYDIPFKEMAADASSMDLDSFNARWRVKSMKLLLEETRTREKVSYDEALQALREYFFIDPVLRS